jgi:hypothetical protein
MHMHDAGRPTLQGSFNSFPKLDVIGDFLLQLTSVVGWTWVAIRVLAHGLTTNGREEIPSTQR